MLTLPPSVKIYVAAQPVDARKSFDGLAGMVEAEFGLERGIKVSMDGKGRCIDNIFVERLWRSVKYEEVYLHAYANLSEARAGIGRYLAFYNSERPHQALGYQTPDEFYRTLQQAA